MNAPPPLSRQMREQDAGVSMTELLIAMLVLSIVSVMVVGFFQATIMTGKTSQSLVTNTKQASNGMNEVSRIIRAGTANPVVNSDQSDPAFVIARSNELVMYAYVNLKNTDQTPIMVRISIDSQQRLVEQTWAAQPQPGGYWTFPSPNPSTADSTNILASTVATPSGTKPMFEFLQANGVALSVPASGLDLDKRRIVAAVKVNVTIQGSMTETDSAVELTNTVGLPNLGIERDVS